MKEVRKVLEWDILKFCAAMQDPRGAFYNREDVREEQLNARILWAFSSAYRRFRKKEYLIY